MGELMINCIMLLTFNMRIAVRSSVGMQQLHDVVIEIEPEQRKRALLSK